MRVSVPIPSHRKNRLGTCSAGEVWFLDEEAVALVEPRRFLPSETPVIVLGRITYGNLGYGVLTLTPFGALVLSGKVRVIDTVFSLHELV